MTGALRTWARRYFWLLSGLVAGQTVLGVGLYKSGEHAAERDAAIADSAAAECRIDVAVARKDLDKCLDTLDAQAASARYATAALGECATTKPCCNVRVTTESP